MLPFEFIVEGPPISGQAKNRERLAAWRATVRKADAVRWHTDDPPLEESLSLTVVYYYERVTVIDNDNLVKPIQDALEGLIYTDDVLITDLVVRKTKLQGSFRVEEMSRVLAEGFLSGREFLYIKVDLAPYHGELP